MKAILTAIQTKLLEVSTLYVNEDDGQLDDYSPNFPVKWPVCLIDISAASFSNIGNDKRQEPANRQEAETLITLNFASLKLTNTSGLAPVNQKNDAWSLHGIIEDAHKVIQGFKPADNTGKLIRTSFRRIKRDDGVQQYQVVYSLGMHNV